MVAEGCSSSSTRGCGMQQPCCGRHDVWHRQVCCVWVVVAHRSDMYGSGQICTIGGQTALEFATNSAYSLVLADQAVQHVLAYGCERYHSPLANRSVVGDPANWTAHSRSQGLRLHYIIRHSSFHLGPYRLPRRRFILNCFYCTLLLICQRYFSNYQALVHRILFRPSTRPTSATHITMSQHATASIPLC